MEYHRLQTLSMNNIPPFDVDKEVKALQEICTKKRNRYWSQLELLESFPQENQRGMILVPLQTIGEPSAVRRQTSLEESDLGPGNTETEAPESNKNSRLERISCRNSREKLHCSGTGSWSGTGSDNSLEKPAGWKESSTCQTASFPTPSRVSYSAELCIHVSTDTNMDLDKMENARMEQV